jgi:hypothetical protein
VKAPEWVSRQARSFTGYPVERARILLAVTRAKSQVQPRSTRLALGIVLAALAVLPYVRALDSPLLYDDRTLLDTCP